MSLDTIKAAVRTIIGSVSNINVNNVYTYKPNTYKSKKFKDLFINTQNQLNTWYITRYSTQDEVNVLMGTSNQSSVWHTLLIVGMYAINESETSENTFQDLIESVRTALRVKFTLNGNVTESKPPQVKEVTDEAFGGIIVHRCVIELNVRVFESYTYT
jgi:hypothetical protein